MSLINHIKQHALQAAQAGDWSAVAETLNAMTTEVRDTTLRSARWLMLQLTTVVNRLTGATEADVVLGTLQQSTIPRVKAAYDSLCSTGIDLSEAQVQQMLPILATAASWPAGLAEKIMQAGLQNVPLLSSPVTAEDCRQVFLKDNLEAIADAAYQQFVDRYNAAKAGIESGDLTTEQSVIAALEA